MADPEYAAVVVAKGGDYEAVVTLGGLSEPPSDAKIEELEHATIAAFPLWFPGYRVEQVEVRSGLADEVKPDDDELV